MLEKMSDYFAVTEEDECKFRRDLLMLKAEQGIEDDAHTLKASK